MNPCIFSFVVIGEITTTSIKKAATQAIPADWTPRARIDIRARLFSSNAKLAAELPALASVAHRPVLAAASLTVWTEAHPPGDRGERLVIEVARRPRGAPEERAQGSLPWSGPAPDPSAAAKPHGGPVPADRAADNARAFPPRTIAAQIAREKL
ncbi:MAG: hypothetical protein L6Q76_17225, partial [Polyangiaceae bacterium]|nr:hypothetical protein [Polyangiaceae bacterium]